MLENKDLNFPYPSFHCSIINPCDLQEQTLSGGWKDKQISQSVKSITLGNNMEKISRPLLSCDLFFSVFLDQYVDNYTEAIMKQEYKSNRMKGCA